MRPMFQTQFGPRGNCMSAALASILELPLESIPNFYDAGPTERDWHNALKRWLMGIGYALIEVPIGENGHGAFHWGGYAIASGPTQRENGWHATVWHDGKIVHDPHPDGSGLTKLETLEFLYPLNPAACRCDMNKG